MMASRVVSLCDELVEWINGQSWTMPVHAERTYDPVPDHIRHDVMAVCVIPSQEIALPEEDSTRGLEHVRYRYELHVRQRYDGGDVVPREWVDARIELVEEMADALRGQSLDIGIGNTAWVESVVLARIWDQPSLLDDQTYVGVIELVVDAWYS